MATNFSTYAALLKRAYKDGVAEQINQEILLYDYFDKNTHDWVGEQLFYAVHTRRAGTAANIGDGGSLPVAGNQTDKNLIVVAKTIADRVQVTTKLMKAAPSTGAGAFLGYMDGAINRLIDDVKDLADRRLFDGGPVKGLLNQHIAAAALNGSVGAFVGGGASNGGTNTWEYSGDLDALTSPFKSVVTGNTNTWVRVRLRRLDTYAEILPTPAGGSTQEAIYVSAISKPNNTIDLTVVADGIGVKFATDAVGAGFGIGLEMHPTQLADAVPANFGTVIDVSLEQDGILTNLFSGTHKSVDRTTATGEEVLQAVCFTQATTGTHARAALTGPRMQAVLDEVQNRSGKDPGLFICNALFRSKYAALLQQTVQTQSREKAGKGDVGFGGFAFNGVEIRTSRHCAKGMIMFLSADSFEVAEYDAGGWMDKDGSMLSRVSNTAAYEAAYTWDWDLVSVNANRNGVLTGVLIA